MALGSARTIQSTAGIILNDAGVVLSRARTALGLAGIVLPAARNGLNDSWTAFVAFSPIFVSLWEM